MLFTPLFIGSPEIIVILLIVVMLFGADKIPEIAKGLGKGIQQIKNASNEIKKEINDSAKKHDIDTEIINDIKDEIDQVKENINEVTGSIKRGR